MVGWLCCFGPEVRLNIMAGSMGWSKSAHSMVHRKQRKEEARDKIELPVTHPSLTCFVQLGPTSRSFHCLPIVLSN
jgi:hypothetical protein